MQIKLKTNPREADPILRRVIEPLAGWIVLLSGMLIACWWPGITEEAATRTITVFTVIAVGVFGWSYVQKHRRRRWRRSVDLLRGVRRAADVEEQI